MCTVITKPFKGTNVVARNMDFNLGMVGNSARKWSAGDNLAGDKDVDFTAVYPVAVVCNILSEAEHLAAYLPKTFVQEGINGAGLSFSLLYNLDNAVPVKSQPARSENLAYFPLHVLAKCKNVDEVKAQIGTKSFYMPECTSLTGKSTVHWMFADGNGKQIVVEFPAATNGKPVIYETTVGVMTNGPDYSWHLTNVRSYINLDNHIVDSAELCGVKFSKNSHCEGLNGLPGANDSPSRFIRELFNMAFLTGDEKDVDGRKATLSGVLGLAFTAKGTAGKGYTEERTMWTTITSNEGNQAHILIRREGEFNYSEPAWKDDGFATVCEGAE